MTKLYIVYSRPAGATRRRVRCECDTLDAVVAQRVARDCLRRGRVAEIKAIDVPRVALA